MPGERERPPSRTSIGCGERGVHLRTGQVAAVCGVHPNTVRQYEALGFLPRVPRSRNGYRCFDDRHVRHVRLALAAMKSTWLGGEIRTAALAVLRASAARSGARARALAREHLDLVRRERRRAEKAAAILDAWACHQAARPAGPRLSIREAAHVLDATPDMLRNWERNGLVRVPRDPSSRHRRYGTAELERLAVIRSLRRARFSVMALLRMFQRFDAGQREGLSLALSELAAGEEDLFFSTDRWLVRLRQIEQASRAMGRLLQTLH